MEHERACTEPCSLLLSFTKYYTSTYFLLLRYVCVIKFSGRNRQHRLNMASFIANVVLLLAFLSSLLLRGEAFKGLRRHMKGRLLTMTLQSESQYSNNNFSPKSMRKHQVQEVQGKLMTSTATATVLALLSTSTAVSARSEFLKEPTEDFKAETAKTQGLALKEKKIRTDFDALIKKFIDTPESDALENNPTEKNLRALINFLKPLDGVPSGIKKIDIVKPCRAKKFSNPKRREIKKTWTKECEIAYQELIQLFNRKMR